MIDLIILAVVLAAIIVFIKINYLNSESLEETDLEISEVSFDPPNGSTLKAQTPILVTVKFKSRHPKRRIRVWAKILEGEFDSQYQASASILSGSGDVTRYVFLTEPGEVKHINIVVKNIQLEEILNQAIPVNFIYENDEELDALANDGVGSTILSFKCYPPEPAILKVGTQVQVEVEYAINAEKGLDLWVVPVTDRNMTYASSESRLSGTGKRRQFFVVTEPCEVDHLRISMANIAGKTVADEYVDVEYKFVE